MNFVIAPIVEGNTEVNSLRVLLTRINPYISMMRPYRMQRTRLGDDSELSRFCIGAASDVPSGAAFALLLVMDADRDCAKTLGPAVLSRMNKCVPHLTCRVAFAVRKFEAWLVGGQPGIPGDDADSLGKLEEKLKGIHPQSRYRKTVDAPGLVMSADLELLARRSRSFRHLQKVIRELPIPAAPAE